MTTKSQILFIGHSHIGCVQNAIKLDPSLLATVVNLRNIKGSQTMSDEDTVDLVLKATADMQPDIVCISLAGNKHNFLGIFEYPEPFSIGDCISGSIPEVEENRHFIPYNMMLDAFEAAFRPSLLSSLYSAFPGTIRAYLNPPPPIGDWDYIKNNPGVFADQIHLGPPPRHLRLALYNLQSDYFRAQSCRNGAYFISPDPSTLTDDGFLARPYFNSDPTHGNAAYGRIMIERVRNEIGETK